MRYLFIIFIIIFSLTANQSYAQKRFYVHIDAIKEQVKDCGLGDIAKSELYKSLSTSENLITKPRFKTKEERVAFIKKQNLIGYSIVFRITQCEHRVSPPAKGKVFKVLAAEISTAIDAEKFPSSQIARAGTGNAQVATEINNLKKSEIHELKVEALKEAMKQNIKRFVQSLVNENPKRKRRRSKIRSRRKRK